MVISARTRLAIGAALTAVCAAAALACNGILGIEQAKVDPTLGQDAAADASTDGGLVYTCPAYCDAIMAHCTGDNAEYTSRDVCLAMCSHFDVGVPGEQANDSLACRVYHATAAEQDPAFHCRHAGPTGGGHCGDQPCNAFCDLDFALCGDVYDGGDIGCRTTCPTAFPYLESDAGDLTLTSGDTLNCRIYHLESAYDPSNPNAKTTHCPHTGVVSATCR